MDIVERLALGGDPCRFLVLAAGVWMPLGFAEASSVTDEEEEDREEEDEEALTAARPSVTARSS